MEVYRFTMAAILVTFFFITNRITGKYPERIIVALSIASLFPYPWAFVSFSYFPPVSLPVWGFLFPYLPILLIKPHSIRFRPLIYSILFYPILSLSIFPLKKLKRSKRWWGILTYFFIKDQKVNFITDHSY